MGKIFTNVGLAWLLSLGAMSCASKVSGDAKVAPDAKAFKHKGFEVERPEGWVFVEPDSTVSGDTVALMQGPIGSAESAPYVEISRRQLNAADRRRKPSHILMTLITEMVQTFSGFEAQGQPEEMNLGGKPASMLRMNFTEIQGDGAEIDRSARFYGSVVGESVWIVRCVGSSDGAADGDFDTIVNAISFDG